MKNEKWQFRDWYGHWGNLRPADTHESDDRLVYSESQSVLENEETLKGYFYDAEYAEHTMALSEDFINAVCTIRNYGEPIRRYCMVGGSILGFVDETRERFTDGERFILYHKRALRALGILNRDSLRRINDSIPD